MFALFRLNYHNQFYAAYPDAEQVQQVKRLWAEALVSFPTEQVLRGARHVIETSEYLPTLHRMLESCQQSLGEFGLPDTRTAYLEACTAASPKAAQSWSHPAVYLAGHDTGWYVLAHESEQKTWPLFRENYRHYCNRALTGESLSVPQPAALPASSGTLSSKDDALAELARLKALLQDQR